MMRTIGQMSDFEKQRMELGQFEHWDAGAVGNLIRYQYS